MKACRLEGHCSACCHARELCGVGTYRKYHASPDQYVALNLFKSCAETRIRVKGNQLYAGIPRDPALAKNIFASCTAIDMYSKCGVFSKAKDLLDELPVRDTVAWNSLIAGYAHHKRCVEALICYEVMQHEGVSPDAVTFACILKACGSVRALEKGEWMHAEILKYSFLGRYLAVANALVYMYAKCGALAKGQRLFDELPDRDVVSWTALITGYCLHGYYVEALDCFERMQHDGLSPNAITYASALKACASLKAVVKGQEIHREIIINGFLRKDVVLGNALMMMYARCGALILAREVFSGLSSCNIASWAGLMSGYCQHGHGSKTIFCFEQMQKEGFPPNAMTFATVLKACGTIGAVEKGVEIHSEIGRKGLLGPCTALGNALIDMYCKCGVLARAQEVFDKLIFYDAVSWTALISGYCEQGQDKVAINCFEGMKRQGFSPDAITYSCILKAYSNTGEAGKSLTYFETLTEKYGVMPSLQHVTNLVIVFAQQGQFDKMLTLLNRIPCLDCFSTVLNACQQWGFLELGKLAFDSATQFNRNESVGGRFLSQILEAPIAQRWLVL